jgi:phosphatidylinositol-3-phosphatase
LLTLTTSKAVTAVFTKPPPPRPASPCGTRTGPSTISKVLWILMENKNYSSIVGASAAPYENQIAQQCGLATNYHAITHPSLPNYIALTSGRTQGITDDNAPSSHPLDVPSIFHQAYPSAKGYAEGMSSHCSTGGGTRYLARHAPWPYYINGAAGKQHTECLANDVPMGAASSGNFHNDVVNGTLPKFAFVTPDTCNDMHDCSVATGDAYLASLVPTILAGPDYQNGRLLVVITFAENAGASGNQVYTAVISPFTRPGTQSSTNFTHYSLLRTTEEILGVPLLGGASSAASMRAAFGF